MDSDEAIMICRIERSKRPAVDPEHARLMAEAKAEYAQLMTKERESMTTSRNGGSRPKRRLPKVLRGKGKRTPS